MNYLLVILLMIVPVLAQAQNSAASFIRQIGPGGQWDVTVGPNGTGSIQSPQPITGGVNTFQLWAQRIAPVSWYNLATVSVSPYTPVGNLSITTLDTWNSNRTREDKAYTVNFTVTMPANFAGAVPEDLNQYLFWDVTPRGGSTTTSGPWNYVAGNYNRNVTPGTAYGTEQWHLDARAVDGAPLTRFSSAMVLIFPLPNVVAFATPPPATVTEELGLLPDTTISIEKLYPANTTCWRVTVPGGTTYDLDSLDQNNGDINSRNLTLKWSQIPNPPAGVYTYQLMTWTPVAGWEAIVFDGAASHSFTYAPTVNVGGVHVTKP